MATKYELGLSTGYVATWGVLEALRELFQNAFDQAAVDPSNAWSWEYDEETRTMKISNVLSVLDRKSLLLGASSKIEDDRTIGKFGEGYKLAILVLLRNDCGITFYNYAAKEIWRTRLVNSKRYEAIIPVVEIEKVRFWDSVPNQNLTVEVTGITQERKEGICNRILPLKYPEGWTCIEGPRCTALTDPDERGCLYVNGIYVDKLDSLRYGYNFEPIALPLDRDRGMVRSFDVTWETSRFWSENCKEHSHEFLTMLEDKTGDVSFVDSFVSPGSAAVAIAAQQFYDKHGVKAYPVASQEDAEKVPAGYKGIVVSSMTAKLVRRSKTYQETPETTAPRRQRWDDWWEKYHLMLSVEGREELQEIVEDLMGDD